MSQARCAVGSQVVSKAGGKERTLEANAGQTAEQPAERVSVAGDPGEVKKKGVNRRLGEEGILKRMLLT